MLHPLLRREEAQYPEPSAAPLKIAITGGHGSVGRALAPVLVKLGHKVRIWDVALHPGMDVCEPFWVDADVVYHLAADKHAPAGEVHPYDTQRVNIEGTRQALQAGGRVILASTCKAVMPETVYGASKLVAERMVLNAGGTVGRLYNVVESSRNVFSLWEREYAEHGVISVMPCSRFFITMRECVGFLASLLDEGSGRFAPEPGIPLPMRMMARHWLEQKGANPAAFIDVMPRRGDRLVEPLCGSHERVEATTRGYNRIVSPHDAEVAVELEAAA